MGAQHQFIDVPIPKGLSEGEREDIADTIIEYIKDRTEAGIDKRGKPFPSYSQAYIESLDFSLAGKSKSKVNLTLSGDMLAELQLLKEKDGVLRIGFVKGSDENARADGNIRGTYGNPSPLPGKKRDFLGINRGELFEIFKGIQRDEKKSDLIELLMESAIEKAKKAKARGKKS